MSAPVDMLTLRAALLEERPRAQHQRPVHLRVDLETDLGAHRRDRPHLIYVKWVRGSRDDAARARRHDLAVRAACERAGGRAGEVKVGSAPVCQTVRAESTRQGHVHGWHSCWVAFTPSWIHRMERRAAEGAAWEAGGVPTRTAKEQGHKL